MAKTKRDRVERVVCIRISWTMGPRTRTAFQSNMSPIMRRACERNGTLERETRRRPGVLASRPRVTFNWNDMKITDRCSVTRPRIGRAAADLSARALAPARPYSPIAASPVLVRTLDPMAESRNSDAPRARVSPSADATAHREARTFMRVIRRCPTGAILFLGRVMRPEQAA